MDRFSDTQKTGHSPAFRLQPNHLEQNQRGGVELRFGPSIRLTGHGLDGSLSAHVLLAKTFIDGSEYQDSKGVQVAFNTALNTKNRVGLSYTYRQETYTNSVDRPRATDRDGQRSGLTFSWQHLLQPDLMLTASLTHEDRNATVGRLSSRSNAVTLGIAKRYASPVAWSGGSWTSAAHLRLKDASFDSPDVMINPSYAERTKELSLTLSQIIPISKNLSAQFGVHAVKSTSNYATSEWSDKSFDFSLNYSF